MRQNQRHILVVDRQLQAGLARRIVLYWAVTWLLVFTLPIMVRALTGEMPFDQLARGIIADFWFPIAISIFLFPIVVWDSFRFSNRVAGPVFRINRTIGQLVDGEPIRPVTLRSGDFCCELADNVNRLIEQRSPETPAPTDGSELLEPAV